MRKINVNTAVSGEEVSEKELLERVKTLISTPDYETRILWSVHEQVPGSEVDFTGRNAWIHPPRQSRKEESWPDLRGFQAGW